METLVDDQMGPPGHPTTMPRKTAVNTPIGWAILHRDGTSTLYATRAAALANVRPGEGAVEVLEGDAL